MRFARAKLLFDSDRKAEALADARQVLQLAIILDGYLEAYEPVAIKSNVRMNGVFLREGETVERVDTETPEKITGNPNVDRPLQRIQEFCNRPNPKVVVTVDMRGELIVLSAAGATCVKCFRADGRWTAIADTAVIRPLARDDAHFEYLFVGRGGRPRGSGASRGSFRAATNQRPVLNPRGADRRGFHANSGRNAD